MTQKQTAQEWARTAHLPHPPRWGEIETELLARAGRPPGFTVLQVAALCISFAILIAGYGAAGIGLVVIMMSDHPMGPGIVGLLQFVYVLAVAMPLSLLAPWADDRQRGAVVLGRSEEHTSELQSRGQLVCRLLLEITNNIVAKR